MSVSTTVKYDCNGCDKTFTTESIPLRATYESAFGGPIVKIRRVQQLDVEEHMPEGWVAYDPYTLMTYCSECWASIEDGENTNE